MAEPCNGCGVCCKGYPCSIAQVVLDKHQPCEALEADGNGAHRCGLIVHPSVYIDLGKKAQWKDHLLSAYFGRILGIGLGCCVEPEYDNLALMFKEVLAHVYRPSRDTLQVVE